MTEEVEIGAVDDDGNPLTEQRMMEGAIEKVASHTVRINLRRAELAIPENLYNYPTAIVHRHFEEEGGNFARNPVETGPYRLERFTVGEEALLVHRDEAYWGGEVYLDRIHYVDLGEDHSALVAALASGQVDGVYNLDIGSIDAIERMADVELKEVVTATTGVTRMRVDREPFDDPRVRAAITRCCDHDRLLELAHRGRGEVGHNHHVAPTHPEHAHVPFPKPDIERAKQLLRDAGYDNGLRIECTVGNTAGPWETSQVQAIREMLAPAGITLNINVVPSATYWDQWTQVPFGLTFWTHRPLGVQVLNLAYRRGVPWNETRYDNPEFEAALDDAMQYADPDERRKKMERVQAILQNDHIMVQPFWRSTFNAVHKKVRGFEPHPTRYHQFQHVWLDEA